MEKYELLELIKTFSDSALATKCEPVVKGDDLTFSTTMRKVLRAAKNGVGLAANQIGILKRAILVNPERNYGTILLNPEIIEASSEIVSAEEGCLSYPGYVAKTLRHSWVVVKYWDKDLCGPYTMRCTGFTAIIVQHEIDHIEGRDCGVKDVWLSRTR